MTNRRSLAGGQVARNMRFRGDRSAEYLQTSRTGMKGKVVGPNLAGQYFLITEAHYDEASDSTYLTAEPILDPAVQLARTQRGAA